MENELVAYLRERLPPHPALRLGPGDDAAVLAWAAEQDAVVTVDMLMDGVDFLLADVDPRRVGHKSLAVNLSDLAAMAAEPVAAVVAIALPRHGGMAIAKALYEGLIPLAERFGVAIAGGDTNSWDGPLVVSITAIGRARPSDVWRRSGVQAGDVFLVTGPLGGSILGKHLDFTPRIAEALDIAERFDIHAAIDISDGLAIDLGRLVQESRCGATIDIERVPIAEAAHQLAAKQMDGRSALDHALGDGEDFELILAVSPQTAADLLDDPRYGASLSIIGEMTAEPGLWQRDALGNVRPLAAYGFEHRFD